MDLSVYGLPEKFLSDNSCNFTYDHFTNMCKAININFKLTSPESPWRNKLVERNNLILGDMLNRISGESTNSIDIAVAWAINAKNSLTNVHGFSRSVLPQANQTLLP